MRDEFKRLRGTNPQVFKALHDYLKQKLDQTLIKMLTCEESSRLHYLRGIGSAYITIIHDMQESNPDKTEMRV